MDKRKGSVNNAVPKYCMYVLVRTVVNCCKGKQFFIRLNVLNTSLCAFFIFHQKPLWTAVKWDRRTVGARDSHGPVVDATCHTYMQVSYP
jgi:hypothetical protein